MTTGGAELLRLLGSGVRPDGAAGATGRGAAIEGLDFASLLRKAEAGEVSSGRTIEVARGAGVTLSDSQVERLSRAADAAEAAGSTRLLAMMDGKALIVNVVTRTVEGAFDPAGKVGADAVLTGVDAAMVVPGKADEDGVLTGIAEAIEAIVGGNGQSDGSLAPPGGVQNKTLATLLAALSGEQGASAA